MQVQILFILKSIYSRKLEAPNRYNFILNNIGVVPIVVF